MRKRNKLYFGIGILIISLVILFSSMYIISTDNLEELKVPVILEISNKTSFNLESSVLNLGEISKGSSSQRDIILNNSYPYPVFANIFVKGNITDFLIFEERVELPINESKRISIGTIVIENQPFVVYTGTLFVRIGKH